MPSNQHSRHTPVATMRRGRLLKLGLLAGAVASAAWAGFSWAGDDADDPCPNVSFLGSEQAAHVAVRQTRPFLGVELTGLSPELRRHFGVEDDAGVMVSKVVEDSAAENAGLAVGDIITGFDDQSISSSWELSQAVRDRRGDEVVAVEYWRDGQVGILPVTLGQKSNCALDLSGMIGGLEKLAVEIPQMHFEGLRIGEEALEEVMESLQSIDWQEHLSKLEALHDENLEDQMERLHEQMERLEVRFGGEFKGDIRESIEAAERAFEEQREAQLEARREVERARIQARAAQKEALAHQESRARMAAEQARALAEEARRREEEQRAASGGGITV